MAAVTAPNPSRQDLVAFAHGMPKAELHVHIEGTIEPTLASKLAAANAVPYNLPSSEDGKTFPFHDLPSFLHVYFGAMTVLQTSADFEALAAAYLATAHAQNIVHAEIFFDPQAHTSRGIEYSTVIGGLRRAVLHARKEYGMSVGLILCFLRDKSVESAEEALTQALASKESDVIWGVGLDSDEKGHPPVKFKGVYERVKRERPEWKLTMHCDVDQVDSIKHIGQAINEIKVDRIDHGSNIVEDDALVEEAKRRGIGLTCCTLSNRVLYPHFKKKEIMDLLRRGVKVTVNSDDPSYFKGYVNECLELLVQETDVTMDELVLLQQNAFEISWISEERRGELMRMLGDYVKSAATKA